MARPADSDGSPLGRAVADLGPQALPWRRSAVLGCVVTLVVLLFFGTLVGLHPSQTTRAAGAFVGELVLAAATVWVLRGIVRPAGWSSLGWLPVTGRDVGRGVLWFLLQQVVAFVLLVAIVSINPDFDLQSASNVSDLRHMQPITLLLFAVPAVLVAPVVEETLFRGLLLRAFMQRLSFGEAAGLSSLGFALLHVPQVGTFDGALLLGIRLYVFAYLQCLLVRRTNRIFPAVVVHGIVNLVAVVTLAVTA